MRTDCRLRKFRCVVSMRLDRFNWARHRGTGLAHDRALRKGSIGACLIKQGASLARSGRGLLFLSRAEEKRDVSKPALAWDPVAKVFVKIWTESSVDGQPPSLDCMVRAANG